MYVSVVVLILQTYLVLIFWINDLLRAIYLSKQLKTMSVHTYGYKGQEYKPWPQEDPLTDLACHVEVAYRR